MSQVSSDVLAVRDERGKFSLFDGRSIILGGERDRWHEIIKLANGPCRAIKIVVMMRVTTSSARPERYFFGSLIWFNKMLDQKWLIDGHKSGRLKRHGPVILDRC
jgi:hypothetical protein